MIRKILLGLWLLASVWGAGAQNKPSWIKETKAEKEQRMAWWTHDRFGMFIHWGLYSLPARHEWIQHNEHRNAEEYRKYFEHFDPDLYDPGEWARKAREAGFKYVVITTKHHEGFCLWDTRYTDYKVTNTPYGKDLIKPFVDACRAEGLRVGFYYSLIDWHHPDFTLDAIHPECPRLPGRSGFEPDRAKMDSINRGRDMGKYQQYMKNQLTELLTNYGQIDELFLDFSYEEKGSREWDSEGLLKLIRKLQPQCIVDDRMGLKDTDWGWDFVTPEQFMPQEWPTAGGERAAWETCQTFSGSWGYFRDEYSWKSVRQLIVMLVESVSKGGNLLLNVGPTARGTFDTRADDRLKGLARWMKFNSRSIYGCTQAPDGIEAPSNCLLTWNPETRRLYVHVLDWPFKSIHLPGLKDKISYAQLLSDGSEVRYWAEEQLNDATTETSRPGDVMLSLPVQQPDADVPVIEIFLNTNI